MDFGFEVEFLFDLVVCEDIVAICGREEITPFSTSSSELDIDIYMDFFRIRFEGFTYETNFEKLIEEDENEYTSCFLSTSTDIVASSMPVREKVREPMCSIRNNPKNIFERNGYFCCCND